MNFPYINLPCSLVAEFETPFSCSIKDQILHKCLHHRVYHQTLSLNLVAKKTAVLVGVINIQVLDFVTSIVYIVRTATIWMLNICLQNQPKSTNPVAHIVQHAVLFTENWGCANLVYRT